MKPTSALLSLCVSLLLLMGLTACNSSDKEIKTPSLANKFSNTETIKDSFERQKDRQNSVWKDYSGKWEFKEGELLQTSTENSYPIILNEAQVFDSVDVSVDFKPISGYIDASGGLVFRAQDEDNYYIVRANALENNFRLYTFIDGLRHQLASATVEKPKINQLHSIRIIAVGNHIQAYLNGKLEIDHHDSTFKKGYTGLWTKADSVTAFDNFKVLKLSNK